MASKYSGVGTILKRGDGGGPEVFTPIPSMSNLDGPKLDINQIDVTTMDDAGGYEQYIAGIKKPGSVTFELIFDPADAQHKGLLNDYKLGTVRNFQLIFSDTGATQWSFAALIKVVAPKMSPKAAVTMSVELQISGAPTLVTT
jgi:predicted secreted protein